MEGEARDEGEARGQMLSTINSTNPTPINSTTSATGSYSSQCRSSENITSILFEYLGSQRQQPMYRTPVSGVFRRRDSGFVVCGETLASVSQFVAEIRHGRLLQAGATMKTSSLRALMEARQVASRRGCFIGPFQV
jgi:hypothetical protein